MNNELPEPQETIEIMQEDMSRLYRQIEFAEDVIDKILIGRPDSAHIAARSYRRIYPKVEI